MPRCRICLKNRSLANIRFTTDRMRICRWCVHTLNKHTITHSQALDDVAEGLRAHLTRLHTTNLGSPDSAIASGAQKQLRGLDDFIAYCRRDGFSVQASNSRNDSVAIKVIRAHSKGLILADRTYTPYPNNWNFTAFQIKDEDGYQCNLCRQTQGDNPQLILHAHHIVHRSKGGSNNRRNLVTLCFNCHQQQHPGVVLTERSGEPQLSPDVAGLPLDTPASTPPPLSQPSRPPPAKPSAKHGQGWLGWIGMLLLIVWSGHLVAGLLGGGVFPYLLGVACGAVLYKSAAVAWEKSGFIGKTALLITGAIVVLAGVVMKQTRLNAATLAATQRVSDPVATAPTAEAPSPIDVPNPAGTSMPTVVPGEEYLAWGWQASTDAQFNAGVAAWFQKHPDYNNPAAILAINSHFHDVAKQYPVIALGPAFDMALARAIEAGRTQTAAPPDQRRSVENRMAQEAVTASARMAASHPTEQQRYQQPRINPPTAQEEADARYRQTRIDAEALNKGAVPGSHKRYDYKTGREIWVDVNGNPLE